MTTLIIATRNAHKAEEIRAVLGGGFQFLSLKDFPSAPALVEDADTFAGNATRKAVQLAGWLIGNGGSRVGLVLADDSGLEVDALDGGPGVRSARFAASEVGSGTNALDAENNAKLLRLLGELPVERRTARFRCVIAVTPLTMGHSEVPQRRLGLLELEHRTVLFQGACEGRIGFAARGKGGFGYDPLFIPDGFQETFAELGEDTKNQLSHRARALEQLRQHLVARSSA